jgi:hypothetical protein
METNKRIPPCPAERTLETDAEALAYLRRVIPPHDEANSRAGRFRWWNLLRAARNMWFYLGRHWITQPTLRAGNATYHFQDVRRYESLLPEPVDNKIAMGVDSYVARLTRKQYEPNARPTAHTPEIEAACRLAKRILMSDLDEIGWQDKADGLTFDAILTGTAVARSYWDETETEQMLVAQPGAARCPMCGGVLASRSVAEDVVAGGIFHAESAAMAEDGSFELRFCPACESPSELQPYDASPEDLSSLDMFGRPLGLSVPKGDAVIEPLSLWEAYPENGGIDVEPADCKVWGVSRVRPMEWVLARFPDLEGEISAEAQPTLLRLHPILGDAAFSGRGSIAGDEIYTNHVIVDEVHVYPMPLPGLEMGREITVIQGKVVRDRSLAIEIADPNGKPRKVLRARYAVAQAKRMRKQFYGKTPVDDAVPVNRRLNELDSQVQEIREKGIPLIALPEGVEIVEPDDASGSMRFVRLLTSGSYQPNWTIRDGLINATPLNGNAYMPERTALLQEIRDLLGPEAVEQGRNSVGTYTAQQLQLQAEQAAQKYGPVERSIVSMFSSLFSHHLELRWAMQAEEREIRYEETAGAWEIESFTGSDILGQTDIKVEVRGSFDRSVYQAAATEKGMQFGLYDLTDQAVKDQVLEQMDLPKIDHGGSIQVIRAEAAWVDFLREGRIPVFDSTVQDPAIWYSVLGRRWESDEGVELRRQAGWDTVLATLAGWERKLAEATQKDMSARAIYEGIPPDKWPMVYAEAQNAFALKNQAAAMTGEPQMPPPPPPPAGGFMPEEMARRLLYVWLDMLMAAGRDISVLRGAEQAGAPEDKALARAIKWYAIIQQCRMEGMAKAQMPPGLPAPGTGPGQPQPAQPAQPQG